MEMVKGIGTYIKNEDLKCLECNKEDKNSIGFEKHDKNNLVSEIVETALKLDGMLRMYMTGSKLSTVQYNVEQIERSGKL